MKSTSSLRQSSIGSFGTLGSSVAWTALLNARSGDDAGQHAHRACITRRLSAPNRCLLADSRHHGDILRLEQHT